MHRIRQHGGRTGARWNRGRTVAEIIEIHPLGVMSAKKAVGIENDFTLQYRKKYGMTRVRGGHNAFVKLAIIPNYTPGSTQSLVFILICLLLALLLLWSIAR